MSLFFPSKQIGRRGLHEGLFFSVKGTLALGIFTLLVYLAKLWSPLSYFIATFIVCFLNYFLALIIFKVRNKKIKKEGKDFTMKDIEEKMQAVEARRKVTQLSREGRCSE